MYVPLESVTNSSKRILIVNYLRYASLYVFWVFVKFQGRKYKVNILTRMS